LGKIVRSAIALGVAQIVVVGRRGVCLSDELVAHIEGGAGGEVGGRAPPPMLHLPSYAAAVAHFHTLGARVCGIEIMPQATSLHTSPFAGPTAFVLGNEGSGLSPPQIGACDDFVYIPQFGQGIASLNVSCAAAIVMYQFCAWAAGTAGAAAEMAAAGEGSLSGPAAGAAVEAQAGGA
jgi:tRNA G18 (ribose-2'-O)-methylase SpoU